MSTVIIQGKTIILGKTIFGATNAIVTSGLVYYIAPQNTSSYSGSGTTVNDLSGNGNTTTLLATTTNLPTYSYPSFNYANVTSDNAYLSANSASSIDNLAPMTASMWLNISSGQLATGGGVLLYKSDNNVQSGWFLEYGNSIGNNAGINGLNMCIVATTNARHCIDAAQVSTGVWLNIVATWDGVFPSPTIQFYINGVLNTSTPVLNTVGAGTHSSDATYPLWFGKGIGVGTGSNSVAYLGSSGIILLYNRVLSSTEILQNFNATRSIYGV